MLTMYIINYLLTYPWLKVIVFHTHFCNGQEGGKKMSKEEVRVIKIEDVKKDENKLQPFIISLETDGERRGKYLTVENEEKNLAR